jgi:hypothetical protein
MLLICYNHKSNLVSPTVEIGPEQSPQKLGPIDRRPINIRARKELGILGISPRNDHSFKRYQASFATAVSDGFFALPMKCLIMRFGQ